MKRPWGLSGTTRLKALGTIDDLGLNKPDVKDFRFLKNGAIRCGFAGVADC